MGKLRNQASTQLTLRRKLVKVFSGLVVVAGLLGIEAIYQTNSALDLHATPLCDDCDSDYLLHELSWGTNPGEFDWPAGQLTQTYSDVAGSESEFTITYSGTTSRFGKILGRSTPNVDNFFTSDATNSLSNYISSGFRGSEKATITIKISPAIPANIGFDLYHINGSSYSGDKIEMYAKAQADGTRIYPQLSGNGSPSWKEISAGTVDAIGSSITDANAYVGVNYQSNTLIDELVFVWSNCGLCGTGVHGFGIGDIQFFSRNNDVVLPVTLLDIQARRNQGSALIEWKTSREINADYFGVERSVDGQIFQPLAEVAAVGNSEVTHSYEYVDQQVFLWEEKSLYYRLRQVELDGTFEYSGVVEVKLESPNPFHIQLAPNPATDQLTVKIPRSPEAEGILRVLSLDGKVIFEQPILGRKMEWKIPCSSWPAGTYLVSTRVGNHQVSKSVQVIH